MAHVMTFLLTEILPELLQYIPTVAWNETWFQYYDAPDHFHLDVSNNLDAVLQGNGLGMVGQSDGHLDF